MHCRNLVGWQEKVEREAADAPELRPYYGSIKALLRCYYGTQYALTKPLGRTSGVGARCI
jgi:hypothetical protein